MRPPHRGRAPLAPLAAGLVLLSACAPATTTRDEPSDDAAADSPLGAPDAGGSDAPGAGDSTSVLPDGADAAPVNGDAAVDAGRRATPPAAVFVHLFEWRWTDIAEECERFLGPKGYSAVQVSPPSEHAAVFAGPWWERYQTVEYALDKSRSGTKAEFQDMVARCARAGVDIYVDAVINHMTGQASGVGSNGTQFTKYAYPGLYTQQDFHMPTCAIMPADYTNNAANVQNCELVGLADLDTGSDSVRTKIADYLAGLVRMGVRGFRIDAAKHISPVDIDAIFVKVGASIPAGSAPYYYLEVIDYGGEAIHSSDYLGVGKTTSSQVSVIEFKYQSVSDAFLNHNGWTVSALKTLDAPSRGLLPGDRAVVFTNNHDTQRATALDYQDAPYHDLAAVFMLAWPYGYPSIMSSYAFDRTTPAGQANGPPSDAAGNTLPVYASPGAAPACAPVPATAAKGTWVCEHRTRAIVNMVQFRRTAGTAPVAELWDDGANQIAFARSGKGFVAINREAMALTRAFRTTLPPGTYCDVVNGDFGAGGCTGSEISVDAAGLANVTVAPFGAVALHVGAKR
jgi:alpha-amylase